MAAHPEAMICVCRVCDFWSPEMPDAASRSAGLAPQSRPGQVEVREVPLARDAQDVGQQQLAVPPRRLVRRQDAVVHPALDRGDTDAETLGYLGCADVLRFDHGRCS